MRILATSGTAGLTAKNLGLAVGITDGAVFKHFADKQAIVDAAIDLFQSILELPVVPGSVDPLERLRQFFVTRLSQVRENPEVLELAFNNSLETAAGPDGATRVRRIMTGSIALIRRCVEEGQRQGVIRDSASPSVLTGMVHGVIQAAARGRVGNLSLEQVWDQVSATLTIHDNSNP